MLRRCSLSARHCACWSRERRAAATTRFSSAITKVQNDAWGPGQLIGIAAIDVEARLAAAGNEVTIR